MVPERDWGKEEREKRGHTKGEERKGRKRNGGKKWWKIGKYVCVEKRTQSKWTMGADGDAERCDWMNIMSSVPIQSDETNE
jgi:hypothetical protein